VEIRSSPVQCSLEARDEDNHGGPPPAAAAETAVTESAECVGADADLVLEAML
jgi:hypothetical protein